MRKLTAQALFILLAGSILLITSPARGNVMTWQRCGYCVPEEEECIVGIEGEFCETWCPNTTAPDECSEAQPGECDVWETTQFMACEPIE